MTSPVSFAETKSAKYVAECFSRAINKNVILLSDEEVKDKIDFSFCALGGANYKSQEIISSSQNLYFSFDIPNNSVVSNQEKQLKYTLDGNYDYAIIIKLKQKLFPKRTQFCVAGLGEWGTSGASWFLANKWKEIKSKVGRMQFGAVVKVKGGSDESAELIDYIFYSKWSRTLFTKGGKKFKLP
jgi:hypothetical protein